MDRRGRAKYEAGGKLFETNKLFMEVVMVINRLRIIMVPASSKRLRTSSIKVQLVKQCLLKSERVHLIVQ